MSWSRSTNDYNSVVLAITARIGHGWVYPEHCHHIKPRTEACSLSVPYKNYQLFLDKFGDLQNMYTLTILLLMSSGNTKFQAKVNTVFDMNRYSITAGLLMTVSYLRPPSSQPSDRPATQFKTDQ